MKRLLIVLMLFASTAEAQVMIAKDESTASLRRIPVVLVDVTDGYTPETAIAIAANNDSDCADATDECCISKNGGTETYCAGTLTHLGNGLYYYEATAGEVDTLGYVTLRINDSAARQFTGSADVGYSNAAFWATAFTTDTGETAATAVAGSLAAESGSGGGGAGLVRE